MSNFQRSMYFPDIKLDEFGKRLKYARFRKKFTLQEVANRSGLSKSYVRSLENRPISKPPAETVYRLSATLHVSMEYLLGIHTDLPSVESESFYLRYLRSSKPNQNILKSLMSAFELERSS